MSRSETEAGRKRRNWSISRTTMWTRNSFVKLLFQQPLIIIFALWFIHISFPADISAILVKKIVPHMSFDCSLKWNESSTARLNLDSHMANMPISFDFKEERVLVKIRLASNTSALLFSSEFVFSFSTGTRTLLLATIFAAPLIMFKQNGDHTLVEENISRGSMVDSSMSEGYVADLIDQICRKRLNIHYKFMLEQRYGREIEKGIWDGIVGTLANHHADLPVAALTINEKRLPSENRYCSSSIEFHPVNLFHMINCRFNSKWDKTEWNFACFRMWDISSHFW